MIIAIAPLPIVCLSWCLSLYSMAMKNVILELTRVKISRTKHQATFAFSFAWFPVALINHTIRVELDAFAISAGILLVPLPLVFEPSSSMNYTCFLSSVFVDGGLGP